ncbi:MAG TPA: hypothetical protein VJC08_05865, partial [bacterium]|nr:hypothetical protein [bacterium]
VFGREPHDRNNIFGAMFAWIKEQYPDFKILGEVYHKQEGYWQGAGVDTTYAKYVYDWIVEGKDGGWQDFKDYIFHKGFHAGLSLEYMFRSLHFLENHDERVRVLKVLAGRLGKKPDDPEVVAWSKLLAAAISTIPGSPLFYEGQEDGRSRHSSSANWVPDKKWLKEHPDTTIPGLKDFYKALLKQTADPVFRRGGFPEEIPHHGGNGSEIAFVRRHTDENGKGQAAVAVFNHSHEKITLRLDLSLIGQGTREVMLEPWGYSLSIEVDKNPPAASKRSEARPDADASGQQNRFRTGRSEVRSETEALHSYFQKGDVLNQGQTPDYEIRGVVLTPELLKNYLEGLHKIIEHMQAGDKQQAAAQILDHLMVLLQKKQVTMFPGILWEDAYLIGKAQKDSILIAHGLIAGEEPLLVLASLFRLAALSWMQSRNMKTADQESFLKGFFEAVFSPKEEARLIEFHRQYVQLEKPEDIKAALDTLIYFMPDSPFFETAHLFETWLDFALKGKRLTMVEEAGFLMKKIFPSQNTLNEFSEVPPVAEGEGAAHSNFVRSAYFKLALPVLAFSHYRYFFFKELAGVLKERREIIQALLQVGADSIYREHPGSTDTLGAVIESVIKQLAVKKMKLPPQEVRTFIFTGLYYGVQKREPREKVVREIEELIYKEPTLLKSFGYLFPAEQHRHLNLPEKPGPEAFKRRIENILALYAKLLGSPNREVVERLFEENFYFKPAQKQGQESEYIIVPGFPRPVPEETTQEWVNAFAGRMADAVEKEQAKNAEGKPEGPNPVWMTYFSIYPQLAWAGLSRVSGEHSIGDYLKVYDTDTSPVGEMTQPYKMWPVLYNDKQVVLQRYESLVWSDIFNWLGSKENIVLPSTTTESLRQFLPVVLGVRKYYEKPAYNPEDPRYQPYAPGGIDLTPIVKRIMDFNLQIDGAFWKAVKQYYQAKNPEETWPNAFLALGKEGPEEDEHYYENIRLWHYSL